MDDFLKRFKRSCVCEVSKYGFKTSKSVFARVVNNVFQNFYVEKFTRYSNARECRIGFSVIPLCRRIEAKWALQGVGLYYLKNFEVNHWAEGEYWKYHIDSEDISTCIDEILVYINKYLLPFFEKANSCETALPELIKLEKLFNDNRKEGLKQSRIEDRAGPYAELNLLDSSKYYMSLKNGDYDFALKILHAILIQNSDSYNSMSEMGYLTEEDRVRRENKISALKDEIKLLEEKDFSYFQRLLKENEAYSRETLKGFLKQPIPETI